MVMHIKRLWLKQRIRQCDGETLLPFHLHTVTHIHTNHFKITIVVHLLEIPGKIQDLRSITVGFRLQA